MASNGLSIKELFIPLNIHGKKQNAMFYFSCLNTGQSKIRKDRNNDYDEETGEKIYHWYEVYEYKQSQKWDDINQLLWSTIIILAFTFIHSYISNKKVLNLIGQNFFHLLSYSI